MGKNINDLSSDPFPENLNWDDQNKRESCEKLYRYVIETYQRAIAWYYGKKNSKKYPAFLTRIFAIIAVTFSGIIPVLSVIYKTDKGEAIVNPGWATIALAIAAFVVSLDHFGGFTKGWIRYIRTAQILAQNMDHFRVEWEKIKNNCDQQNPPDNIVGNHLEACRQTLENLHETIRKETDEWAEDFGSFIVEMTNRINGLKGVGEGTGV